MKGIRVSRIEPEKLAKELPQGAFETQIRTSWYKLEFDFYITSSFRRHSRNKKSGIKSSYLNQNGGEGGIDSLRSGLRPQSSTAPSPLRSVELRSHPLLRLRRIVCWAAPNGGEGGIRTLGGVSPTHPSQGGTIGHSVTSPLERCGANSPLLAGQSINSYLLSPCDSNKSFSRSY